MAYTYDPAGDELRLKRKRLLAEQLAAQVWQPYNKLIDAGAFKVANWGDAVGQLAKAWASRQADRDLTADEANTLSAQREYETGKTKEYMDASRGAPIDSGARDDMSPEPSTTRSRPDFTRALAVAMNSKVPGLMKLAEEERKSREQYLRVPGATVASRSAAYDSGDPTQLVGDPKIQNVNGQIVATDESGANPRVTGDFGDKWESMPSPTGAPPGQLFQRNTRTGKVDTAGGSGTTVNVGDKRENIVFGARVKGLETTMPDAQKALQTYSSMQQALPLVAQAQTGAGADLILQGRKWLKLFGVSDDEIGKISNTEQLRSRMARLVYDEIKNLGSGTGLSDADREFAQNASLSTLELDPRALEAGVRIAMAKSLNTYQTHQANLDATIKAFPNEASALTVYSVPDSTGGDPTTLGLTRGQGGLWTAGNVPTVQKAAPAASTATPAAAAVAKPAGWSDEKWQRYLFLKKQAESGQ